MLNLKLYQTKTLFIYLEYFLSYKINLQMKLKGQSQNVSVMVIVLN